MPTRGERIAQDLDGYAPGGLLRPRKRPVLSDATVNRDELTLSYAGSVRTSPAPPVESFTVTVDGNAVEVSAVQVAAVEVSASGAGTSAVTLMLESEVVHVQVVTVSYVPGSIPIQHAKLGTPAAPLSGVAVVNDTPNEAPVLSGPAAVPYNEGGTGVVASYVATDPDDDTILWSLSGTDSGDFENGNTGNLTFKTPPNYENRSDSDADNNYQVTVNASDGSLTATLSVTVTVNNINEAGTLTLSSPQPQAGTELAAELNDPDNGVTNIGWSWERSQNRTDWTSLSATTDRYTPAAADVGYYLRASVVYDDVHGAGKNAQAVSTNPVRAATPPPTPWAEPTAVPSTSTPRRVSYEPRAPWTTKPKTPTPSRWRFGTAKTPKATPTPDGTIPSG